MKTEQIDLRACERRIAARNHTIPPALSFQDDGCNGLQAMKMQGLLARSVGSRTTEGEACVSGSCTCNSSYVLAIASKTT